MPKPKHPRILREIPPVKLIQVARAVWSEQQWDLNKYYHEVARRVTGNPTYGLHNRERQFLADMLLVITSQDDD